MSGKNIVKAVSYVIGQTYAVKLSQMHWFPAMNENRAKQPYLAPAETTKSGQEGKEKWDTFYSLVNSGWETELPAQGVLLNANGTVSLEAKKGPYTVAKAIEERKAYIAAVTKAGETALANMCKELWFPGGKAIEPVLCGNSGFTRGLSMPRVVLEQAQRAAKEGKKFDPASVVVYVSVCQFKTELERLQKQARENELRKLGMDVTWPDRIKSAKAQLASLPESKRNQIVLRQVFGDGNGQKLYAVIVADERFPELRLVERIGMDRPEGFRANKDNYSPDGFVPMASIPQNATGLRDAKDAAEAEEWLAAKVFEKKNSPRVTEKIVWDNAKLGTEEGSPFAFIRECHIKGLGIDPIREKYPQLFSKACVLSLAAPEAKSTEAKSTEAKSKSKKHAKA